MSWKCLFFLRKVLSEVREVTAPELLAALRKIEARGHHESAHRAKQKCRQVFRYAIVTGRAERGISADLRGALVPVVSKNHAAITDPAEIGALLRASCDPRRTAHHQIVGKHL